MRVIAVFTLAVLGLANFGRGVLASPEIEEVVRAWDTHADSIQTAHLVWRLATIYGTGDGTPKDHYEATHKLTIGQKGERRYEIKGQQLHPEGGLSTINNIYVDDAKGNWRELTPTSDQADYPIGFINEFTWGRRDLYPLLWILGRSKSKSMSLQPSDWVLLDRQFPVDDSLLWQIEEPIGDARQNSRRILVDPEHGFRLCRVEEFNLQQQLMSRWDIAYTENDLEWIPSTWSYVAFLADGTIHWRKSASILDAAVNQPVEPGTFELDFPVGTVVYDERAQQQFLQLENGARRIVTPEEQRAGISHSVAMRTKSGEAAGQNTSPDNGSLRFWLLVFNGVILLMIGAIALWRKPSEGRSTSNSNAEQL